jgi:hypothetical protein
MYVVIAVLNYLRKAAKRIASVALITDGFMDWMANV